MYRISLGSLTVADTEGPDVISAAAAGGCFGVNLRITGQSKAEPFPTIVGNPARLKALRQRMQDTGVILTGISAYQFLPETKLSDYEPILEIASELGVKTVGLTSGEPDQSRFIDLLSGYADMVAKIGARISIEFMAYREIKTIGQCNDVITKTGKSNIGITADILHLIRSGGTPADVKKVDPKRIYCVQFCDGPRQLPAGMELRTEARLGRYYPGEGELPLYDFLDALPAGWQDIEIEIPHPAYMKLPANERVKKAADATRAYLEEYSRKRGR